MLSEYEPYPRAVAFPKEPGALHQSNAVVTVSSSPEPPPSRARRLTPQSVNYAAVGSVWFAVGLRLFGIAVLAVIGYTMYQWEMSHYEYCAQAAVSEHLEAMTLRATHCEDRSVTQAVRASRAVTTQCINAARTIIDGDNIYKWNCFISKHMVGAGSCSSYPACAYVVEWIETIREDMYVILIFGSLFLLFKILTSTTSATSSVVNRAMIVTEAYRKKLKQPGIIPTHEEAQQLPSE